MSDILHDCPKCHRKNFTREGLRRHKCKYATEELIFTTPPPPPLEAEIITSAEAVEADLKHLADAIDAGIDLITGHEDAFEEATLEHRLEIGMHVSKAQEVFTITHAESGSIGGQVKPSESRRDSLVSDPTKTPQAGFAKWLYTSVPRLKKPTAYKYALAYRSLGLPDGAGISQIRAKIKDLRHEAGKNNLPMPRLGDLYKAAKKGQPKPVMAQITLPDTAQLRLEDAREHFYLWREDFEQCVRQGVLDDLDRKGLLEMKEFLLGARDRVNARLK